MFLNLNKQSSDCLKQKPKIDFKSVGTALTGAAIGALPLVTNIAFAAGPSIDEIASKIISVFVAILGIIGVFLLLYAAVELGKAKLNGDSQPDLNKVKNSVLGAVVCIAFATLLTGAKSEFVGWIQGYFDSI